MLLVAALACTALLSAGCTKSRASRWAHMSPAVKPTPVSQAEADEFAREYEEAALNSAAGGQGESLAR